MGADYSFDLVSVGECLVEFNREPDGRYMVAWGGDAVNAVVWGARLGLRTGFVSTFGDDIFTANIRDGIVREGVDLSLTEVLPGGENGLYFIDLDERGEYTFHFRRRDSAATETLRRIDGDRLFAYLSRSSWVLLGGITLAVMKEPERLLPVLERLRASAGTRIAFDTNYRPALWPSADLYRERVAEVLPFLDLFLPSEPDLERAWEGQSAEEVVQSLGVRRTAMKRGEKGCLVLWEGERLEMPVEERVKVADTTGAGDAFNAGFLAGLVRGEEPPQAARRGMKTAGRAVQGRGALSIHGQWYTDQTD